MHVRTNLVVLGAQKTISQETVDELEELVKEAKAGTITGIAYVAMHRGADISFNAAGRARFVPVYTLGAVESLKQYISSLLR